MDEGSHALLYDTLVVCLGNYTDCGWGSLMVQDFLHPKPTSNVHFQLLSGLGIEVGNIALPQTDLEAPSRVIFGCRAPLLTAHQLGGV